MNQFQEIFDKQKAYFDRTPLSLYEWRIDQLTRLENLCNENAEVLEAAMSSATSRRPAKRKSSRLLAPCRNRRLREARFEGVDEARRCVCAQGPSGERAYC